MAPLIGGPQDGYEYYTPNHPLWFGVVLPLSPDKDVLMNGDPGAWYQWNGKRKAWLFTNFVPRGYDHDSLTFAPEFGGAK